MSSWRFAPRDELREPLARVLGADHEALVGRRVRLAVEVGLEQLRRFLHQPPVPRDDAEAAALVDVEGVKLKP